MFTTTSSVPINEPGEPVKLTPEQVWAGLKIRARNEDERFVPPGHTFKVIEDRGDEILRSVELAAREGELQRISFHGGKVMLFDFLAGPQRSVVITAIEADDDGEYYLRFTFLTEFKDMPHHSESEQKIRDERRPLMLQQPTVVLKVIRQLAAEGRV